MRSSLSSQTTLPDFSRGSAASSSSLSTARKEKRNMSNFFRRGSEKSKERRGSKEGEVSRGSSFSKGKRGSGDVEVRQDSGISQPSISTSVSTPAETEFDIETTKFERPWTEAHTFVKEPGELSPVTRIDSTMSEEWTNASFGTSYQSMSYLRDSSAVDDRWVGDGRDMTSLERALEYQDLIGEHPLDTELREKREKAGRKETETHMWGVDTGMDKRAEQDEQDGQDEQVRAAEAQGEMEERNKAERARREREVQAKFEQAKQKAYERANTERLLLGMEPWEDANSRNHDRDTVMSSQTTWSRIITEATEKPQSPRAELTKNVVRMKVEVQTSPVSTKSLTGSFGGLSTPTTPRTPVDPTNTATLAPFVLPSTLPSKSTNNLGSIPEGKYEETPALQLSKSLSLKKAPESKSLDAKPSLLGRMFSKKETQKGPIRPGPPSDFRHIQHTRPEDVTSSPDSKHSINLSEEQAFLMAKEQLNKIHSNSHRLSAEEALGKSRPRNSSEREGESTSQPLEEGKSGMYRLGEASEVSVVENPKTYRGDAISGFSQHNDTAYESWRTEADVDPQTGEVGKERGSLRPPLSPGTPNTMPKWFGLLTSNSQRPSPNPTRNITHPPLSPSTVPPSSPASTPIRNITHPLPSSSRAPPSSSPFQRAPTHPSNPFTKRTPPNPSAHNPPPSPPSPTPTTPDPFTPQFQMPKRRPTESLLAADKRLAAVSHARGGMNPPTESFIEARERTRMRPYAIPDQVDNFKGARRR